MTTKVDRSLASRPHFASKSRPASDCSDAKAKRPSGSLSRTNETHRLQKLHTPSKRITPLRPLGSSKFAGIEPESGPVAPLSIARGTGARATHETASVSASILRAIDGRAEVRLCSFAENAYLS